MLWSLVTTNCDEIWPTKFVLGKQIWIIQLLYVSTGLPVAGQGLGAPPSNTGESSGAKHMSIADRQCPNIAVLRTNHIVISSRASSMVLISIMQQFVNKISENIHIKHSYITIAQEGCGTTQNCTNLLITLRYECFYCL